MSCEVDRQQVIDQLISDFTSVNPLPDVAMPCGCTTGHPRSVDCQACPWMQEWLIRHGILGETMDKAHRLLVLVHPIHGFWVTSAHQIVGSATAGNVLKGVAKPRGWHGWRAVGSYFSIIEEQSEETLSPEALEFRRQVRDQGLEAFLQWPGESGEGWRQAV